MPNLTCTNFRVTRIPAATILQQRLTVPGDWRTLRPAAIDGVTTFCVGTPDEPLFYPLDVLVPHVLTHEIDVDYPLPDAAPTPTAIDTLPDESRLYLLHYMLGYPREALPVDTVTSVTHTLRDAKIHMMRSVDPSSIIEQLAYSHRLQNRILRPDARDPSTPDVAPLPLNQVVPIPAAMVELLRKNERDARGDPKRRKRWPFTGMAPLTQVRIPAGDAIAAQRAVHVLAKRKGWVMRTRRDRLTGDLTVMRLEDRRA